MSRRILLAALVAASAYAPPVDAGGPDRRFIPAIRAAASQYQSWGRVDEKPNIAPFLCRVPRGDDYGAASRVRSSRARGGPHGEKLYYLWASERHAYEMLDGPAHPRQQFMDIAPYRVAPRLPVGFTVVKQSFTSRPAVGEPPRAEPPGPDASNAVGATPPPITWVHTQDGRTLQIDQPADLYVMVKVGDGPGTDAGWIYGTVSPGGKVTSAGRVRSCMGCHERAEHERLFGLRE